MGRQTEGTVGEEDTDARTIYDRFPKGQQPGGAPGCDITRISGQPGTTIGGAGTLKPDDQLFRGGIQPEGFCDERAQSGNSPGYPEGLTVRKSRTPMDYGDDD